MKNKYGMNIPEDQIDQTIEEAKNKKRMYAFPEEETNYIRYDEKGKSYIASVHGFDRFLYNNPQFAETRNDPNSYDGTVRYFKSFTFNIQLNFNHVKPGNYKLYLNQCFQNKDLKGGFIFKIFVSYKQIYEDNNFPNDEMLIKK